MEVLAMSLIRGVLLTGRFRSQRDLNGMSDDDQRNTLITELVGRTNQPVGHYQAMDDATLAGAGAVLVFVREAGVRDDAAIRMMSDDDLRNTLIVEIAAVTGRSDLQGLNNLDLVQLGLRGDNSYIKGVMMMGRFRNFRQLNAMSADGQRNTLITELVGRTNQPVGHYQAMDDATLAGAGAILVFIREARIRDDATIRTMSDDDLRNTAIVEIAAQPNALDNTPGTTAKLQGSTNLKLIGGWAFGHFRGTIIR
jgi:hypothetical protein